MIHDVLFRKHGSTSVHDTHSLIAYDEDLLPYVGSDGKTTCQLWRQAQAWGEDVGASVVDIAIVINGSQKVFEVSVQERANA